MKVKELIEKMSGASAIGINTQDKQIAKVDMKTVLPYLDLEVFSFTLSPYDLGDDKGIYCMIFAR